MFSDNTRDLQSSSVDMLIFQFRAFKGNAGTSVTEIVLCDDFMFFL